MPNLPFDTILASTEHGPEEFTPSQFMALPLDERLRYVLEKRVRFSLNGKTQDPNEALRALGRFRARLEETIPRW
jgi:hypothetical protein